MIPVSPIADPVLFFRDLALVFVAAVVGGLAARVTRQPLILGYVFGGLLISPLTPGPAVSDLTTFERFAEIGVVLLMFSLGIEFSLQDLMRVRWVALLGGPLGIAGNVALGLGAGWLLGWPLLQGAVVGMVVSVASTMVLARLLLDRGELHSRHGRIMIGTVLVEDLAVVALIVVMPRLGGLDGHRMLAIAQGLGLAAAVLVPFFYLAAKVVPRILLRVARLQSQELFLLVALAIALGTAAVTQAVGMSLALGAFLAGLLISGSDFAHEALARLLPIRDAFVALFFVTVGAIIDPGVVLAAPILLAAVVALVVPGKFVIRALVTRLFGYPLSTALLVGIGLTQIGEFSFVLVQVARAAGHVGHDVYTAILAASLLTILINAALVRWAPRWMEGTRLVAPAGGDVALAAAETAARGHTVVCGFGRVGSAVADALEAFDVPYVAIDVDPDVVRALRGRRLPSLYGDAASREILERAGAGTATLVVLALPDIDRAHRAVRVVRELNPGVPILARAHTDQGRDRLAAAGATEVIQPEFEAATTLIRHALHRLTLPRERVMAYLERFRSVIEAIPERSIPPGQVLPEIHEVVLGESDLADQSLAEAGIRERFGVTILGITRADGEVLLHPTPQTSLRSGDRLRVFGLREHVEEFARAARVG
jgi:CPA2 family monovalent cation:H+ antiporter-2